MASDKWYIKENKTGLPRTEREYFYGNPAYDSVDRTYDASGRLISETKHGQDYLGIVTYEYGENDVLLSSTEKSGYTGHVNQTRSYDVYGNAISETNYDYNGTFASRNERSFDAKGNMMSQTEYAEDGTWLNAKTFGYDDKNRKISSDTFGTTGTWERSSYVYDDHDNVILEKVFDNEGNPSLERQYQYDTEGRLIGEQSVNPSGEVTGKKTYSYLDGHLYNETEISTQYKDGEFHEVTNTKIYTHDDNGNVTSVALYEGNVKQSEDVYTYDANGNRTSSEHLYRDEEGNMTGTYGRTEYAYDDTGTLVSTRYYDKDGNIRSSDVAKEMIFGGKVYTFNAQELSSVIGSLESSRNNISNILKSIKSTSEGVAGIVEGEDSSLGPTLRKLSSLCETCEYGITSLLEILKWRIDDYITKTIMNEEATQSELSSINYDLDDISNSFIVEND